MFVKTQASQETSPWVHADQDSRTDPPVREVRISDALESKARDVELTAEVQKERWQVFVNIGVCGTGSGEAAMTKCVGARGVRIVSCNPRLEHTDDPRIELHLTCLHGLRYLAVDVQDFVVVMKEWFY